jgi:hypothetical protein
LTTRRFPLPWSVEESKDGGFATKVEAEALDKKESAAWLHVMPPRPEFYRAKAAQCERAASLAIVPSNRQAFMNLAKQWRQMADDSENDERPYLVRRDLDKPLH